MKQIIVQGDCRELAPADIAACHVMLADPPYRAHVHANATSHGHADALDETRRGTRKRDLGFASLAPALRSHVALLATGIPRWSVIYSDIESLAWWRLAMLARKLDYVRAVPWVRWSMPQLSGDRPPQGWEALSLFHPKGKKRWNGPGNLTCLEHKCLRGEDKHKAEKPLDQALDLVSWFSDPGETIFDPFAGAGTIGLACRLLGRGYLGIELDANWVDRANARIAAAELAPRDTERQRRWLEIEKARTV